MEARDVTESDVDSMLVNSTWDDFNLLETWLTEDVCINFAILLVSGLTRTASGYISKPKFNIVYDPEKKTILPKATAKTLPRPKGTDLEEAFPSLSRFFAPAKSFREMYIRFFGPDIVGEEQDNRGPVFLLPEIHPSVFRMVEPLENPDVNMSMAYSYIHKNHIENVYAYIRITYYFPEYRTRKWHLAQAR